MNDCRSVRPPRPEKDTRLPSSEFTLNGHVRLTVLQRGPNMLRLSHEPATSGKHKPPNHELLVEV